MVYTLWSLKYGPLRSQKKFKHPPMQRPPFRHLLLGQELCCEITFLIKPKCLYTFVYTPGFSTSPQPIPDETIPVRTFKLDFLL